MPLTGSGILAYVVAILYLLYKIMSFKFKIEDIFFLVSIIVWFLFKVQQSEFQASTVLLRYYFGFYIFYLFFNNINIDLDLEKLLFIICVAVLLEAVLINTIIKPTWLPNYPKAEMGNDLVFETKILGFYQRPYSIGTNSTITSTLIMVLLFYSYSSFEKRIGKLSKITLILSMITVVILGSGTGYMLLLLFIIYRIGPFRNSLYAIISCLSIFILYYLIFIINIGSIDGLEKISSIYLQFLYDYKVSQVDDVKVELYSSYGQTLIGKQFENASELIIWSDFAWNNLLLCTGFIGLGITLLIFIFKTNKYNWVPISIFIVGAIHYGAMYALPGQLLMGYLFSSKFKNKIQNQITNVQVEINDGLAQNIPN